MKNSDLRFKLFLLLPYLTAIIFFCFYYFLLPVLFPKIGAGWYESSHTIWSRIRFLGMLCGPVLCLTYSLHVILQVKTICKEELRIAVWSFILIQALPEVIVIVAIIALFLGLKKFLSVEIREECK